MARAIDTIDELRTWMGREAGVSDWLTVTQERINQFAALSEDLQWIHIDVDRAQRESPFGSTIAHGFLTVALLTRMVRDAVEIRVPSKLTVNYGFNRLRFPAPVPAGSRIRAHLTPNSVKEIDGAVEIAWGIVVEIENQSKPALAAEWLLRMYF
ncbi:MAG TPA: MaoC family dehydratase [Bryobacteraceae bacterium]|jgi:acyl dehydratase